MNHEIVCPMCRGKGKVVPTTMSVGMRFQIERAKLGLTQAQLAPKLHIGRSQLASIETDRSRSTVDVLLRAAQTFQVSTDYLLGVETALRANQIEGISGTLRHLRERAV